MRSWRNRQTRTFEGRMGNRPGSSPGDRTTVKNPSRFPKRSGSDFFVAICMPCSANFPCSSVKNNENLPGTVWACNMVYKNS